MSAMRRINSFSAMPHAAVERACSMDSLLMRAVLDASNDTEKKKKRLKPHESSTEELC